NTLSPGEHVLAFNNGHFSHLYAECARRCGMIVEEVDVEWGRGLPIDDIERKLRADQTNLVRAVLVVHNETSTGVTSDLRAVRSAMDRAGHPALLLVDAVSSLGSIEFEFDRWGID